MRYLSTRGDAPVLSFDEVLLAGLARDGGLYLPESWPQFSAAEIRALAGKPYAEIAFAVLKPFVGDSIAEADLKRILDETYAGFGHEAVALTDHGAMYVVPLVGAGRAAAREVVRMQRVGADREERHLFVDLHPMREREDGVGARDLGILRTRRAQEGQAAAADGRSRLRAEI